MSWFKTIAIFALMAAPLPAYADGGDPMVEGAKLCTRHLPRFEREYAIPTHLLSAIATTESGRFHEGLGMKLPWPWAINAAGKGYWFESKEKAIAAVKKLRARGVQSIDVGCMQVNLYQHPDAFSSLDQAFEPQTNIAYAAGFLRGLYDENGTWKKAAADYHSRTPSLGREYVGLVYDSWYTIIDKLRTARLQVPESAVAALNDMKGRTGKSAPVQKPYQQASRTAAPFEHPHMNSVKVSTRSASIVSDEDRQRSLIIVRSGDSLAPEIKTADSTPLQSPVMTQATSQPAMTAIPVSAPAIAPARRSGPNFIFND